MQVADGEWDALSKLIPRPVQPVVGKTGGECHVHGRGAPRRKSISMEVAGGEWDALSKFTPRLAKPVTKTCKSRE